MGNKSSKMTVSRDSENAAEISKERPTSELHSKANTTCSYDEYDNYTMSVESNRFEIKTSEHSYAPCEIKELQETHGEETKKKNDIQGICEIEEEQGLNQPYVAIERRLPTSSLDVNVLDAYKTTPSQVRVCATANELINNQNASSNPKNSIGQTESTSVESIGLLTILDSTDVTIPAQEQPYFLAAEGGQPVVSNFNETPLHIDVREQHINVPGVILKHSIYDKSTKQKQTLHKNNTNLVETRSNTHIELLKSDGRRVSAEIVWAETGSPQELTRELSRGYNTLERAVMSNQPKWVKRLLSVDQCVYSEKHLSRSFRNMTQTIIDPDFPLDVITRKKHRNVCEIVQSLYWDTKERQRCKKIKEIAHIIINSCKFNVNNQDYQWNTLLHIVVQKCSFWATLDLTEHSKLLLIDVVQLLLEKGADSNIKNVAGETPLIIASENGCCEIIQTLFDWEQKSGMKLDIDARDQFGATALIKAAKRRHVAVMRLLLDHKVSVNLHDYYGFTALHAVVYEPIRNWFDLHFFCRHFRKREFGSLDDANRRWSSQNSEFSCLDPYDIIYQLDKDIENHEKTASFKEEIVRVLLSIDETNVNATDFRGNTPLDLAVKYSQLTTSETIEALKNSGAIRKSLESEDEAAIYVSNVDEKGRNPLHRLSIFLATAYKEFERKTKDYERFNLLLHLIILKPENFRKSAITADYKGRTPLHYAVMAPSYIEKKDHKLVRVLLDIGSKVNATDIYGKTPLHYAETNDKYELLVHAGADESTTDRSGHTPRDLRQLRESVTMNTDNVKELLIGKKALYTSRDIAHVLETDHVTELSKLKLPAIVRIYSQSTRPEESSEEAVWKVCVQNDFLRLNRRVSQLRPSIQRFIERLADGIKERDPRFECQPRLVGSADEETKVVISADFDYNFKLINFSQLCDVFPHPLGPNGYFQLRSRRDNTERRQSDDEFDCFFDLDLCLLTNEVNSRFQIVLIDVLRDPNFWKDEHLFEWNVADESEKGVSRPISKTLRLRMIDPIADEEGGGGGFLFVNVSISVVACVQVDDSRLGDEMSADLNPALKADGCTFVFDRPRFDHSKSRVDLSVFSDTIARISFAPTESRIIRESSSVIKAAYMVCKLILYNHPRTTYQLKTSLLFCMEALEVQKSYERRDEDEITSKELAFWVERLMFCFVEFSRHDFYPCYFMPLFRQKMRRTYRNFIHDQIDHKECIEAAKVGVCLGSRVPVGIYSDYCVAFDIYLDLCPDNTVIDIPIVQSEHMYDFDRGSIKPKQDPKWEGFDRGELIRKLSSRSSSC